MTALRYGVWRCQAEPSQYWYIRHQFACPVQRPTTQTSSWVAIETAANRSSLWPGWRGGYDVHVVPSQCEAAGWAGNFSRRSPTTHTSSPESAETPVR